MRAGGRIHSIGTLIALLAGRKKAKIHQIDVNTAFLYNILNETVYVEHSQPHQPL